MRELDRVCREVLLPPWAVRKETKLLLSLPAKVYPCAAVKQISRLSAWSVCFSEGDDAATCTVLLSFSPKKKDRTSDNMSTSDFTEYKDNNKSRKLILSQS